MKGMNDFVHTRELLINSLTEALLQAILLLDHLHRMIPVHEIMISDFMMRDNVRKLYPRCKTVAQIEPNAFPFSTIISAPLAENYLYPIRKPLRPYPHNDTRTAVTSAVLVLSLAFRGHSEIFCDIPGCFDRSHGGLFDFYSRSSEKKSRDSVD